MVSLVDGHDLVLDKGLRFQHASGEEVTRLEEGDWNSTVTTAAVHRGDKKVPVTSAASFATGQQVKIISDAGTEWDTVEVRGEHKHDLFLEDGLLFSHPAGAKVVGEGEDKATAGAPPPREKDDTKGAEDAMECLRHHSKSGSLRTETTLKGSARAGDSSLEVWCTTGFQQGDSVRIEGEPGEFSEVQRVSSVDHDGKRLHFESALAKAYPKEAAVARAEEHILGEYGFLSEFDGITEEEARQRVRRLASLFGVREFEFYNAFKGYSAPPADHEEKWHCACFGMPVRRSVLQAYTDEIEKLGGRSWLTVVGMATDPGDAETQRFTYVIGHQVVEGKSLLDAVEPTAELARSIAPRWAGFAKGLGFSGIHWATVNGYASGGGAQKESDVKEFLQESGAVLKEHGLQQTWNFLNGFGWEKPLVSDGVVAFTIWETFDHMTDPFQALNAGVVKSFPVQEDEDFESALDYLSKTWARARCNGMHLLAVGDGSRILRNDYYPSALDMTGTDTQALTERVFREEACSEESSRREGSLGAESSGGESSDPSARREAVQLGVMQATVRDMDGAQVGRDQYPMLEGILIELFGYSKCHVDAWQHCGGQGEDLWTVRRARRLTGEGSSTYDAPFEGRCHGSCADHSSVTSSQVRDALQQALQRHGIEGEVESARIIWGEEAGEQDHEEFRIAGIGEHNLKYIIACLLIVIVLCAVIVCLECCWHKHAMAKEAAHHEAFSSTSRQDVVETDRLEADDASEGGGHEHQTTVHVTVDE